MTSEKFVHDPGFREAQGLKPEVLNLLYIVHHPVEVHGFLQKNVACYPLVKAALMAQ